MRIYLNELSFNERIDVTGVLLMLSDHVSLFRQTDQRLLTRMESISSWLSTWESEFDASTRNLLPLLIDDVLEECEHCEPGYYYYHQIHQDFGNSERQNISGSSLASAADRELLNHLVAVLNIPGTSFSSRPQLHIYKSPYDKIKADQLALLPCFQSGERAFEYIFLKKELQPNVSVESQEKFINEFWELRNIMYTESTWEPKTFTKGTVLNPDYAFPASSKEVIKSEIQKWKIKNGSYENNVAEYIKLGDRVMRLHSYMRNDKLSKKYKYEIYEGGKGSHKLLISLDTENGLLEAHDGTGYHLGAYNYVGELKKSYDPGSKEHNAHCLVNVPKSMLLFP